MVLNSTLDNALSRLFPTTHNEQPTTDFKSTRPTASGPPRSSGELDQERKSGSGALRPSSSFRRFASRFLDEDQEMKREDEKRREILIFTPLSSHPLLLIRASALRRGSRIGVRDDIIGALRDDKIRKMGQALGALQSLFSPNGMTVFSYFLH